MQISLNASDLAEKGGFFASTLVQGSKEALRLQAAEGYNRIVSGTYWTNRTNRTRATFTIEKTGQLSVSIVSKDKVAHFLNVGTEAHEIKARKAPLLRFYWARLGTWFAGEKVNHPGTRATAFAKKEAFRALPELLIKGDAVAEKAVSSTGLG